MNKNLYYYILRMNLEQFISIFQTEWETTNTQNLAIIIVSILVFFWIIAIIRTAKDISARTESSFFHIISVILVTVLTPIIWIPLYLAIRPIWYKRDKTSWRDSCLSNSSICQNCWTLNPKEYKNCIKCGEKIKTKCKECGEEYPYSYHYCPSCWAPNIG